MPNLIEFTEDPDFQFGRYPGLFGLFKGASGIGKSVSALSFPKVMMFDLDRKMPGVALKHYRHRKDINWMTFADTFEVSDELKRIYEDDNYPYETLIFDSLTHLVTMCLNTIGKMKGETAVDMMRRLNPKSGNAEMMGMDYYNGETNFIARYFLDMIKAIHTRPGNPKHVILIGHIVTVESSPDLKTKIITRTSSMVTAGKKAGAIVPTIYDDAWHFGMAPNLEDSQGGMVPVCITKNWGEDSAKCSYPLPDVIRLDKEMLYDAICRYVTF